jgi:CubicO group peptidase (beta-lactamase class C family)
VVCSDYLKQVTPVRCEYLYNNHVYNIAGLVMEGLTGDPWEEIMQKLLFEPLGMTRTFTKHPNDNNVAAPYTILSNGTPYRLPFCNVSNDTMMFAGQSVRTSSNDLQKYAMAYLEALATIPPLAGQTDSTDGATMPSNPIREIATLVRPHVTRPVNSLYEQSSALGWN